VFASPGAVWRGRPVCEAQGMIEMSSAWRDDSRGTNCSNPFSATGGHTNPITATDRVPSDEQLGKPGNVGGPGNADDDYS
jgi:hypothetical protein